MKKLVRIAGLTALAFSLSTGVAAAATGSIEDTGWWSFNKAYVTDSSKSVVENDNDVDVKNEVDQDADSGDALVYGHRADGDAETGDADNAASFGGTLAINSTNSADEANDCGCPGDSEGSISGTGTKSYNKVVVKSSSYSKVENDNDVEIRNEVDQDARSGDATVKYGDGSATTGSASNTSSATFNLSITQ